MKIRKAGIDDEQQIIDLLKKLLIPSGEVDKGWNDNSRMIRRIIENPESGAILVAEDDGVIAGITTLSFPTAIRCDGLYSCIEENIVDEKYRGQGVGGKLLRATIAEAAARGCKELQVNNPSKMGYPLYLRNGFEDKGKHLKIMLNT